MRLLSGLLLATLLASSALAAELKDDPGGFNGIRWGSHTADVSDLQVIKEQGDFKTFRRSGNLPVICDMRPDDVKYQFYKDQLEAVLLSYSGKDTHRKLVTCAVARFGPVPLLNPRLALRVEWEGPSTVISLSFDPYANQGMLWFSSRALGQQQFDQLEMEPLPRP